MSGEALRGPHRDIVTALKDTGVTPYQQRRANRQFYSLSAQIAQESEDPIRRMEQLMLAFPAYRKAVEIRLRKGHLLYDIANSSPAATIEDALGQWVLRNGEILNAIDGYGLKPLEQREGELQKAEEPPSLEEMLKALQGDDFTFTP